MARLLKNGRGALARSVEGFRRFAVFCQEFDVLLRSASKTPLLRDAFWHAHSYWFDRVRKRVGRTMDKGIDNLLEAARSAPAHTDNPLPARERRALAVEVERHAADLKRAISRLTLRADVRSDAEYGAALKAFAR